METNSFWKAITPDRPEFGALQGDFEADVAIVGGGITGITAALQLTEAGKKVVILESRRISGGVTGWSTGNLYIPVGPNYSAIKSARDFETAKTVATARATAIDFMEKQIRDKNISCEFARRPWYNFTSTEKKIKDIEKEAEIFRDMGFDVQEITESPIPNSEVLNGFKMDGAARFNPMAYTVSLASYLAEKGCTIFENTKVTDIVEKDGYCILTTTGGKIRAGKMILATHIPLGIHSVQTLAAPYRSYVVAVKLNQGIYPEAYIWHEEEEHHAITTHATQGNVPDILMVAGRHHKTGQADEQNYKANFEKLEAFLRKKYDVASVEYTWSSQHYRSGDFVPYIGLTDNGWKNTYIATGYYADGLTYGTVAGILLSDMILEKENPWLKAFDSTRSNTLSSIGQFLKENINVAGQYLKDLPGKAQASHFSDVQPGEGKTVSVNGEKYACYRDETNKLHVVSAVCTHMKCIVNWNNAEKTWDCPCHGSRFMTDGSVIEGPAISNLPAVEVDESKEKILTKEDEAHNYDNPHTS